MSFFTLAALEGHELAGLLGTLVVSVVGSFFGAVKWLGKHFDRLGEERRAERDRDQKTINEQRTEFLAALDRREASAERRDQTFVKALAQQEAECSKQRELDRDQRDEERRVILRLAGYPSGDTAKIKAWIDGKPPGSSPSKEKAT